MLRQLFCRTKRKLLETSRAFWISKLSFEESEESEQEEYSPPVVPIKPKAKAKPPVFESVEHPPLILPEGIHWEHYYLKSWGHMVVPKRRSGPCLDGESTELCASFLDYSLERARCTFDLIGRIDITMLSMESLAKLANRWPVVKPASSSRFSRF